MQEKVLNHFKTFPTENYYVYGLPPSGIPDEKTVEFYYYPFDGHANRLGHYYRHLFQTTKYVISQENELINESDKYEYIKTLRAQLSNYEQLLIYYNALAWFDEEWKLAFTDYRLIKNLPLPLADFHQSPKIHFAKEIERMRNRGVEMFEWHE